MILKKNGRAVIMTINDLILYTHDRLKKEWYETPNCGQVRRAFEHIDEELSKIYTDCINRVFNERMNSNAEKE